MSTTTTSGATMNGNGRTAKTRPVHEVRMGRIRAAIWENQTEGGVRFNVTLSRLYKDGDQWKDSASLGRDDLPLASRVLEKAHDWIFEHGSPSAAGQSVQEQAEDVHF